MIFRPISPKDLHAVWGFVRPGLERVVKKNGCGWIPEDVYAAIRNGRASLYMGIDDATGMPHGFFVLEKLDEQFTGGSYVNVWALYAKPTVGKNYANVLQYKDVTLAEIDRIARSIGISDVRIHGRKGWEKVFGGDFKVRHVVYERKVT